MTRKSRNKIKRETWNKDKLIALSLGIFSKFPQKNFNYKQISKMLEIKDDDQRQCWYRCLPS